MSFRIACRYQDSTEIDDEVYPDLKSARRRLEEMRLDPIAYGSPQIIGACPPAVDEPDPEPEPPPPPVATLRGALPPGYRVRLRWVFLPIEIAGRYRRMETVRVVQRYEGTRWEDGSPASANLDGYWQDVGFWEEVYPTLTKAVNDFAEL